MMAGGGGPGGCSPPVTGTLTYGSHRAAPVGRPRHGVARRHPNASARVRATWPVSRRAWRSRLTHVRACRGRSGPAAPLSGPGPFHGPGPPQQRRKAPEGVQREVHGRALRCATAVQGDPEQDRARPRATVPLDYHRDTSTPICVRWSLMKELHPPGLERLNTTRLLYVHSTVSAADRAVPPSPRAARLMALRPSGLKVCEVFGGNRCPAGAPRRVARPSPPRQSAQAPHRAEGRSPGPPAAHVLTDQCPWAHARVPLTVVGRPRCRALAIIGLTG